jgi:hypothetical protein
LRGGKLRDDQKDNPGGGPSIVPLEVKGKPGDRNWMELGWPDGKPLVSENTRRVTTGSGLYLLEDSVSKEIVYIGQSASVMKRLLDHSRKTWNSRSLQFTFHVFGKPVLPHNLKELENDLIGNYFENFRKSPEYQFKNST